MSTGDDLAKYIPAAWRAYQHLGEIRALQQKAQPHIDALLKIAPEARELLAAILPEDSPAFTTEHLQMALNKYGGAHLVTDGIYGEATAQAVEKYQRDHGLTVDKWAGLETLKSLWGKIAEAEA